MGNLVSQWKLLMIRFAIFLCLPPSLILSYTHSRTSALSLAPRIVRAKRSLELYIVGHRLWLLCLWWWSRWRRERRRRRWWRWWSWRKRFDVTSDPATSHYIPPNRPTLDSCPVIFKAISRELIQGTAWVALRSKSETTTHGQTNGLTDRQTNGWTHLFIESKLKMLYGGQKWTLSAEEAGLWIPNVITVTDTSLPNCAN